MASAAKQQQDLDPLLLPSYQAAVAATESLTPREHDVMHIWLEVGATWRDVADELCISEGTVRTHLASIYGKLGVSKRREAARVYRNRYPAGGGNSSGRPAANRGEWSFLNMNSPFPSIRVIGGVF